LILRFVLIYFMKYLTEIMVRASPIVENFRTVFQVTSHFSIVRTLLIVGGLFSFGFFLFQKKLLPLPVAKAASQFYFYPTFPFTALLRLGNYWTPIDDTLIVGCAPMSIFGHPAQLHKLGVRGVVNMCYEYPGPKAAYSKLGIKQLHLPTVDHTEPSVDKLIEAVEFIKQHKDRGEKVYVHCKAGHGRAASIALCWLMKENDGFTSKELNNILRNKRCVRAKLFEQSNIKGFEKYLTLNK